ncbi:hypothetical protein GCM10023205_06790 [Yinghuangia aomiensis]|uniref:Homeodomain-like domain-containing protein n=1 Tax=Yinghuangia aomiensis TaxID=676205 RepID=A0ABP9GNJ9_9ACTN
MKAKTDDQARARALRLQGKTYDDIALELGVSKSSVSLWVRDLPRPRRSPEDLKRHMDMMRGVRNANLDRTRARNRDVAQSEIEPFTERDLLVAGVALYWAEGTKSKPWRRSENVVFINSDPGVITVFMAWLRMLGIVPADCSFRVSIHETADVAGAQHYWAALIGIDAADFMTPVLKKHNPKTVRYNTGDGYKGCLIVRVKKGAQVYQRIEGWWTGIVEATRAEPLGN